ncbi:MAG: carboxypeptidase M32 [Candidatus Moranbacteria bacterium]|nr:carboxypeptidase M32 [Candidatus Moranbacteria bacterium]
MNQNSIEKFKEELAEIYHLGAAVSVLHWDQDVNMPKKGMEMRAKSIANLSGILHDKFVSPSFSRLVRAAKKELDGGKLSDENACIVREIWREFSREKKLPLEFVKELSETTSVATSVWAEARKENDFGLFLPYLKKIVSLKRKEAELVGYKDSPYDALLDAYEPGMTAREIEMIFSELRDFLVPFLANIMKSKVRVRNILKGKFPIERQVEFNKAVAEKIGFDFDAGRLDISTHPFTTQFHPGDVRITTRYSDRDPFYSIGSTIHESGHALYEQGIPMENFGSPLGDAISLGIHESQSRMWENIVGRSENFWKYFFPRLKKAFPKNFDKAEMGDIYRYVNAVKPSLIRTEADEVTYNLHIIMRFEIEKELIEGSIAVEDLPKIWNSKVKEYFGIDVPNDALGVLQDVHWSGGLIGYFPTYALGNLYSAQFYEAAKRDVLNLEKEIRAGQFAHLLNWLRKNIHIHGKMFTARELIENASGEPLNAQYFMDYIEDKYSRIYGF